MKRLSKGHDRLSEHPEFKSLPCFTIVIRCYVSLAFVQANVAFLSCSSFFFLSETSLGSRAEGYCTLQELNFKPWPVGFFGALRSLEVASMSKNRALELFAGLRVPCDIKVLLLTIQPGRSHLECRSSFDAQLSVSMTWNWVYCRVNYSALGKMARLERWIV